jgi:hypothetical protein
MTTEAKKPLIALLQPCASLRTPHRGAVRGFLRPSERGLERIEMELASSSLPRVFNRLWINALNMRDKHNFTHVAMLHNDCAPDGPWLDILYDEQVRTGADMVSVAIPIKSSDGYTSTAVSDPDGDPWINRRLTMAEVFALPETFGIEDIPWAKPGAILLANTGCFLMRFDEAWVEDLCWRFENRTYKAADGQWMHAELTEDWLCSHDLAKFGKRVVCTRKVKLEHELPQWHNRHVWGTYPIDMAWFEYQRQMEKAQRAAAEGEREWYFPDDVAGWLTETEGRALADLARGKAVLEIGSYFGRSTVCMAQTASHVHAVDPFDGRATNSPQYCFPTFMEHLCKHGLLDKVTACVGTSAQVVPQLQDRFDFVFIDGAHDKASVLEDTRLARAVLKPGGCIAYHDYADTDKGVIEAVDELVAAGARIVKQVESVAVLEWREASV